MKYAIVAGHSSKIPGAFGCGYAEHEVARQMTAKVLEYMKLVGAEVVDCTDNVGKDKTAVWSNAVKNTNNAIGSNGLAISIHLNAAGGTATGTEVLHYNSAALAAKVSAAIAKVLGVRDRGPKDGKQIGYINSTKSEAILIELCFIDNPADMEKLMRNFDAVAKVIVETVTGKVLPEPKPIAAKVEAKEESVFIITGGYKGDALAEVHTIIVDNKWWFDTKREENGSITFLVGGFGKGTDGYSKITSFLTERNWWFTERAVSQIKDWK